MSKLLFLTPFSNFDPLEDEQSFLEELGIEKWEIWVQSNAEAKTFIHCIEGNHLDQFFEKLANRQENADVKKMLHQFPGILENKKIEKVLELHFESPEEIDETYRFCYFYPLLPEKVEEQIVYCHQAMNEKKEETVKACRAFGMVSLRKWIQQEESASYLLYEQEASMPYTECRRHFLSLKNDEKAINATQAIRNQTGCAFEDLLPQVELFYRLNKEDLAK